MKKYDCNKTLDYVHELKRICTTLGCCECPMSEMPFCKDATTLSQEDIDFVQKWSDEHPEPPKLTKKERTFLECFAGLLDERMIKRTGRGVYYYYTTHHHRLKDDLFTFIENNTSMTFEELLKLEVEE